MDSITYGAGGTRAPKTVLMTADSVGGVFGYAIELARGLARRGTRVVLAVMGGPLSAAQREEAASVPGLIVRESGFKLEWMDDPWEDVARAGDWLLDLEAKERPDIVHHNGFSHAALPFEAPQLVVAHSSVTSWFRAVLGEEAPARFDRYRVEVTRGIAAARALVAPTRAMLAEIARDHGAHPRARVIPNGRDPELYRPGDKDESVLAVGRLWDAGKNIAALSAVAPRLPWPVRVAGSDVAPEGSRRALKDVVALGVLSAAEARAAYARAAIYALPARYEPFGLSILEAALSGSALVLGDIPSLRELWGGAALFVDPGDADDLERALRCLITHRSVREALAARARQRAMAFTPERMVLGYTALYGELAAQDRRPSDRPRAG